MNTGACQSQSKHVSAFGGNCSVLQYYCGTNSFSVKHNPFILPGSTTHYARDRDYDIQHVRLDLAVDPEKKRLEGTAHLTLKPITENVTRLEFDAVELEVKEVKLSDNKNGSGSRKANYEKTGREVKVHLDKGLKTPCTVNFNNR